MQKYEYLCEDDIHDIMQTDQVTGDMLAAESEAGIVLPWRTDIYGRQWYKRELRNIIEAVPRD